MSGSQNSPAIQRKSARLADRIAVNSFLPEKRDASKPPFVLVHGAWHGGWCWEGGFAEFLVDAGHEVHIPDLRGHGESASLNTMRWNRISQYVDDVETVIASIDRPPVVVGHSMGGYVCQHLMKRDVAMAGIALLATVPSFGVWKTVLHMVKTRPIDFLKSNLTASLYPLVDDPQKAKSMFLDDDASSEAARDFQAKLTDESYLAFLDMLILDLPRSGGRTCPMIVISGESDALFGVDTQRHTADRYDCLCHVVAGAPHDIMLSRHWQAAADILLGWISRDVIASN